MLELSEQEFKTTMVNTLRALMDKVDNMQEQMGYLSREVKILRKNKKEKKNKKETLELKNTNRSGECL